MATKNINEQSVDVDGSGRLGVRIEADNAGIGGGTQYNEDAAHSSGDTGTMLLAVRKDTAAALAGTDGDYIPLSTDSDGKLHVTGTTSTGESDGTTLTNAQVAVNTSATQIVAASAGRAGVIITNQGSTDAFVGTATVTTSNGFKLGAGESLGIPTDSVVQAIVASGSTTIAYLALA